MIWRFRTATVEVGQLAIVAVFNDGHQNTLLFAPIIADPEYQAVATLFGYADECRLYAIHHELTHHWLADELGWQASFSVREDRPQPWPSHIAWEEHIVNRLQRFQRTGEPDEYGVLQTLFGSRLSDAIDRMVRAWEPLPQ